MNPRILHKDVQEFIDDNRNADLHRLILKGHQFEGVDIKEIAGQIQSRDKCRDKLPTWHQRKGIYYPKKISIEQSSSEITAQYKSELFTGDVMADLTGGFGVDAFYFCRSFKKVFHCETQEELSRIVAHNAKVLNLSNLHCIADDGLAFAMAYGGHFDLLYLDPARRGTHGGKVFRLGDCEPDLGPHLDDLLKKTDRLLIKLSPLLDISSATQDLKYVSEVRVVAVRNEVKELLLLLERAKHGWVKIIASNYERGNWEEFTASGEHTEPLAYSRPLSYIYEPNSAILKAGLFNEVSNQFKLYKLHPNSHLYTSDQLISFPGRRFELMRSLGYSPKKLQKELDLKKANITTRNFPERVAQIRKRTRIQEGGDDYLFFTTDLEGHKIVLHCRKPA